MTRRMRTYFDKSMEIDTASREGLVETIGRDQIYSAKEDELIRVGMTRFALFEGPRATVKRAKAASPTVTNQIAFEEGGRLGWGWSESLVRATKEEVSAFERARINQVSLAGP